MGPRPFRSRGHCLSELLRRQIRSEAPKPSESKVRREFRPLGVSGCLGRKAHGIIALIAKLHTICQIYMITLSHNVVMLGNQKTLKTISYTTSSGISRVKPNPRLTKIVYRRQWTVSAICWLISPKGDRRDDRVIARQPIYSGMSPKNTF